jgi:hypothetical protein
MEDKPEDVNKIEYYTNGYLKSVTGSQEFIDKYKDILPPKELPTQVNNNSWARWAPEFFTLRLYHGFTYIRVPLFYILIVVYILNAFWGDIWAGLPWTQEDLGLVVKYSTYLLLTVGALVATWLTIVLNIIKVSERAGGQWANLVKYVLYPIVTAILISIVTLLQKFGVIIPAPFSLSLLIGFLLLNAIFTTIKEAEHLANASYGAEDK